jgi:hypothetical protein
MADPTRMAGVIYYCAVRRVVAGASLLDESPALSGAAPGPQCAQSRTTTQRARTPGIAAGSRPIGNLQSTVPLKQGLPRSLLDHVLVTEGRTRAAGVLIWPASPRPDAWADHDAVIMIADIDLRSPAVLQATSRKGPKAAHMFPPSQWLNLGRNSRVRQELATIKEHLGGECEQETLNDLFDRFLKIGVPKAAAKETTPRASRQGPLHHILHNILGQLRASNSYVRRCLQRVELQEEGQTTIDRAKLAAILCRHADADGTGIYDNPALGGLLTWDDTWSPERRGEWLQQLKTAKKFVQRTLKAA